MGSRQTIITFTEKNLSDYSKDDQELIANAHSSLKNAYAPYSGFKVGCAVALSSGRIITGNNQENAAYPSGLCAERVALFAAKSQYKEPIATIVVLAQTSAGHPANAFSCGNCRQVMMEYASQQSEPIRILMLTEQDTYIELTNVKELLPFHFNSESLR